MSAVIGIKTKAGVWIGADSALTSDERVTTGHCKLFKIDELLIGMAGSYRAINVIRYLFTSPPHLPNITTDTYIGSLLVPCLIKCFEENGIMNEGSYREEFQKSTEFIIAYQNRLFEIDCAMGFVELEEIAAIGVGDDYAEGIYETTKKPINPNKLIKSILKLISENFNSVKPPFVVLPK